MMENFLSCLDRNMAKSFLFAGGGLAIGYALGRCYVKRTSKSNSSDVYETNKALNEYLAMHYGQDLDILLREYIPTIALQFARVCALRAVEHYQKSAPPCALDLGCAVGGSSFELARHFNQVVGMDYSQSFIDACNVLKEKGSITYKVLDEGELTRTCVATIPADIDRSRILFQRGDACNIPTNLGQFGCVLASNLICRLRDPRAFLYRLPSIVATDGIVVITSPYTFLEQYTLKENWLGGYIEDGKRVIGFETMKSILGTHFDLIVEENLQFFIRETARKNQWSIAHCTIWKRKNN